MAELKSVYIDRTGDWCRSENDTGKFYLKSEADKVIADLQSKVTLSSLAEDCSMSEKRTFDCLEVTHVDVYPLKDGVRIGKTEAITDIVLNDQLQLQLRVMNGENGLYVGYPTSQFCKGDEFQSICLPLTSQLHKRIEECVLEKYKSIIKQGA